MLLFKTISKNTAPIIEAVAIIFYGQILGFFFFEVVVIFRTKFCEKNGWGSIVVFFSRQKKIDILIAEKKKKPKMGELSESGSADIADIIYDKCVCVHHCRNW